MKNDLKISIPADYKDAAIPNKAIKKLSFGKQKILLSDDEVTKLEEVYQHYVNTYGVEIGFITYLLNLR